MQTYRKWLGPAAIAVIVLTVCYNIFTFIILPAESNRAATQQLVDASFRTPNAGLIDQVTAPVSTQSNYSVIYLGFGLLVLGAVVSLGWMGIRHSQTQSKVRDQRRLKDLDLLAQAFEKYFQAKGHYPISSSYRAEYYTGINLSNDWHYYGLPTDDDMRVYLPEWPISDPSIDYRGQNQMNQYIYYPRDNGATFDLYAHLENPLDAPRNYNQSDNLPQAWGQYNYKHSGLHGKPAPLEEVPLPLQHPWTGSPAGNASGQPQPTVTISNPPTVPTSLPIARPLAPEPPTDLRAPMSAEPPPSVPTRLESTPAPAPTPPVQAPPVAPVADVQQPSALPAVVPLDTSLEPQAVNSALSAATAKALEDAQEIDRINQLFSQGYTPPDPAGSTSSVAPITNPNTQAPNSNIQPASPPAPVVNLPAQSTPPTTNATLSQMDRLAQAVAARSQMEAGPAADE